MNNRLLETLRFDKPTESCGRNGYYKSAGIEVFRFGDTVRLTGITSRGKAAIGHIEIPVSAIAQLNALLRKAHEGNR